MFFFRSKKIHLHCYTSDAMVHKYVPIDTANKFIPNWWKELPKTYKIEESSFFDLPTMKSCEGFLRLYKHGIIMPLWSDLSIKVNDKTDGRFFWQWGDRTSQIESHGSNQRGNFLPESTHVHLKSCSPWVFECNEEINWAFVSPEWNLNNIRIMIPTGIVDYRYQHTTSINMFIEKMDNPQYLFLRIGDPIAHIIPLSERPVELHVHKISQEEFIDKRTAGTPASFIKAYKTGKKLLERKCPFKF